MVIRNFLVTLKLFLNAKCSFYPYEVNWQIGHGKWFLNTNMFLIKLFLITNFDCIRTQVLFKGGSYMRKYGMHHWRPLSFKSVKEFWPKIVKGVGLVLNSRPKTIKIYMYQWIINQREHQITSWISTYVPKIAIWMLVFKKTS